MPVLFWLLSIFVLINTQSWGQELNAVPIPPRTKHGLNPPHLEGPISIEKDIQIVLTFDDGPHLVRTPRVLDLLDQYGMKAIFFVNGERFWGHSPRAEQAQEILRQIIQRGHMVGNHTVHHYMNLCRLSSELIEQEITQNSALIEQATGRAPTLFRAPGGMKCPKLTNIVEKLGIQVMNWNVDPWDWKWRDRNVNLAGLELGLLQEANPGTTNIVLMHDIHEESVETLPLFFEWLRTQPHIIVADPKELFRK